MEKLKLALDDLVVESFAPSFEAPKTGTIHAHNSGPYTDECQSCGVDTGCGGGCVGTEATNCGSCGCNTATCYGYWSCDPVATCACQDTASPCDTDPMCTGPGAQC